MFPKLLHGNGCNLLSDKNANMLNASKQNNPAQLLQIFLWDS